MKVIEKDWQPTVDTLRNLFLAPTGEMLFQQSFQGNTKSSWFFGAVDPKLKWFM